MTSPSESVKQILNPFELFNEWFETAKKTEKMPESMTVATATKNGLPSARTLLLKEFNPQGFTFYTNIESRQGQEMLENPNVALLFYWPSIYRQIRIEGKVTETPEQATDAYFHSRPYLSQIGARASQQSRILNSRDTLLAEMQKEQDKYPEGSTIPRPDYWRGFILKPVAFEFWEGKDFRVHDRVRFEESNSNWKASLLYP